jgi:hypothetical protein
MHHLALHSDPAPVDNPYQAKALPQRLIQILLNHAGHLSRLERMEINPVFNREFHRLVHKDRIPPIVAARAAVPPVAGIYRPDRRTATVPDAPSARLFSRVATTAAAGTTPFSCAMRA